MRTSAAEGCPWYSRVLPERLCEKRAAMYLTIAIADRPTVKEVLCLT
jgi:hypothetical protein